MMWLQYNIERTVNWGCSVLPLIGIFLKLAKIWHVVFNHFNLYFQQYELFVYIPYSIFNYIDKPNLNFQKKNV